MSWHTQFVGTPKGICVLNPIMSEFTLCGDAFDLATDEPGYSHTETKDRFATCVDCVTIIQDIRSVKVRTNHNDKR